MNDLSVQNTSVQNMTDKEPFKYALIIFTYGRPKKVYTVKSVRKAGYTGRIILLLSDDDPTIEEYREQYKNEKDVFIRVFNKDSLIGTFDKMDNFGNMKVGVFARNYIPILARKLKLDGYVVFDDDYTGFHHRYTTDGKKLSYISVYDMDAVNDIMFDFLKDTGATTVAFAQGGDLIGGCNGSFLKGHKRKAMNSFYFLTDTEYEYSGTMNDDVNFYIDASRQGAFILTTFGVSLVQVATQASDGGMTEFYKAMGTYVKSFYSVMRVPSAVTVSVMRGRLHHEIQSKYCMPQVIHEKYKK